MNHRAEREEKLIGAEAIFTMETPIGPVYVALMADGAVRWEATPTTRLPRDQEGV